MQVPCLEVLERVSSILKDHGFSPAPECVDIRNLYVFYASIPFFDDYGFAIPEFTYICIICVICVLLLVLEAAPIMMCCQVRKYLENLVRVCLVYFFVVCIDLNYLSQN